jgi:quinoprotein glucose dehydrogenase
LFPREEPPEIVQFTLDDSQAEAKHRDAMEDLSLTLADNLEVTLWAPEELLSDPVAIHMDDHGRMWVSITERRRNAELDIRGIRHWITQSIMMETVEERREFVRSELDPENSEYNTWLEDYNEDGVIDWRDLTVQKESIRMLEDTTGSGFANKSTIFIRDFNDMLTDVAGAVLYHEGDVYLGVSPDMWRIRDTTGDGYGNEKESISHGFGVNFGYGGHGMSGLIAGPDGRLYWSIGDVGMSVTDQDGKTWHYPRQGVIVRAEPDGSNFEVFAHGLRNTHEFSFDKHGNLITVDNDGDHAGEFERLVYLVDGSDSGWRLNWQFGKFEDDKNNDYNVLMEEEYFKPRFEGQAAHILPPLSRYHSGPAGMAYNPGTALGEEWNDHFFVAEFVGTPSRSGINAFTLKESGASFELDRDVEVLRGILATGVDFGPDGALYFADWLQGWALKDAGRIWKLDSPEDAGSSIRIDTQERLAEDFSEHSSERLLELLTHDDMRVRQKAQFELASRNDAESLLQAVSQTDHQLKRVHGIWGLAQIGRRDLNTVEPLIGFLNDSDSEIRAQAAKMLGDVRYEPAADALIERLSDEHPRVQFFAIEALGRIAWEPAFGPIIDLLESNDDEDVYLRHGAVIALERIGNEEALGELNNHSSRSVRVAAVAALNRLASPEVIPFLQDEDEFIVTDAARAINDDTMIREGLPELSAMLEQNRFINEPLLRRAINAALYNGTSGDAERLIAFTLRDDIPEELRTEALETLAVWEESSVMDRVTGDPRGAAENNPEDVREAFDPAIEAIFAGGSDNLKIALLGAVSSLKAENAIPSIEVLIREDPSADVRIASLNALVEMEYEEIEDAIFAALEDGDSTVRMNALREIPNLNLPEENIVALIKPVAEDGTVPERQVAFSTLGTIQHPAAYDVLKHQFELLKAGELPPEAELELVMAVESAESDEFLELRREYETQKSLDDSVGVYRETLYGGDAERGRQIFYQDAAAQCIRCHVVDGQGSDVGPDLTDVASRLNRSQLLQSMVNPNARIAPGYGTVTLTMDDGEVIRGQLTAETASQITVTSGEEEWVVNKDHVAERVNSPSGMFAMGDVLSRSELRDLVEFLMTLEE